MKARGGQVGGWGVRGGVGFGITRWGCRRMTLINTRFAAIMVTAVGLMERGERRETKKREEGRRKEKWNSEVTEETTCLPAYFFFFFFFVGCGSLPFLEHLISVFCP
jgi:hypothetical protein